MKSPEVTIRQVSMEWLGMKKLVVKQSTYAKYESIVGKSHRRMSGRYSPLQSEFCHGQCLCRGKKWGYSRTACRGNCEKGVMCAKTVRDICTILKSIIRYGENEYHLQNLVGNTVLPRAKAAEKEILNVNEVRKFERYSGRTRTFPGAQGFFCVSIPDEAWRDLRPEMDGYRSENPHSVCFSYSPEDRGRGGRGSCPVPW